MFLASFLNLDLADLWQALNIENNMYFVVSEIKKRRKKSVIISLVDVIPGDSKVLA